jgi:hypothetical protein
MRPSSPWPPKALGHRSPPPPVSGEQAARRGHRIASARQDASAALGRIGAPTLVLHGTDVDELSAARAPAATADDLLSVLTIAEGVACRLDQVVVAVVADLLRRGTFAERSYRNAVAAVADLLGWNRVEARRRVSCGGRSPPATAAAPVAADRRRGARCTTWSPWSRAARHRRPTASWCAARATG